jgi:hypothetical protein
MKGKISLIFQEIYIIIIIIRAQEFIFKIMKLLILRIFTNYEIRPYKKLLAVSMIPQ